MNKKSMILAVGVLAALASTALPGAASAEEAKLLCESGAPCTYAVHGNETRLSLSNGDTLWCSTVTGEGRMTNLDANNEASTDEIQLLFHECKEQATVFHFRCSNTATAGTITTNVMVTHAIKLPGTTNGQGALMTGANTTFTCAGGFASTQVTGNLIGELDEPCGHTGNTVRYVFSATSDGNQTLRTYTGNTYDLESETSHTGGGSYETFAITSTTTLTFNQNVVPTC